MAKDKDKMGFVRNFMAHNVNISAPDTNANWEKLLQYVQKCSVKLTDKYGATGALQKVINFPDSTDTPDKLLEFSKSYLSFITSADRNLVKNDPTVYDIAKLLAEVAKPTFDSRVITIVRDIVAKLVSYQNVM